ALSYRELNSLSNRLAHHLRALGVGPDRTVAICAAHSIGFFVGVLSVLKAGGAFVPLDAGYPAERLVHMLRDSAPVVLLHDEAGAFAATLPHVPAAINLATDQNLWCECPHTN